MKAMLLAAGLAKRLRPLTEHTPKALVEIGGVPLMRIAIEYLAHHGFDEIIINVHHHAEQIVRYLKSNRNFGHKIVISDETNKLLDTGGGLKKAAWFFDDGKPFLVYNVDILSDLDLGRLYHDHIDTGALATLAVRGRSSQRYLLFDGENNLCGWQNLKTGETINARESKSGLQGLAFSGIHVISPEIFEHFLPGDVFSLIDLYLQLAGKFAIKGFRHDETRWIDVGKPENLAQAVNFGALN
jgi:NDP-sugar pyrophosphorylase family protein